MATISGNYWKRVYSSKL